MIYEYQCQGCGAVREALVPTVAEGEKLEQKACPECGKRRMKRTVTAPQLHIRYSPMHPRHMRGQRKR
ncbi:MAG: hypothetical protein AMS22_08395 [Thiotrichales bacterium SG8_50]|nr:MAG: hypothetical protein AMS22_08395 [Thiotrichales bacterium SG8_50]